MSYIKREPLLQIAQKLQGDAFGAPLIVKAIEEAPGEDVVEVIRCENCEYCHEYTKWNEKDYLGCNRLAEFCDGQIVEVGENDFCSHGERRMDDDSKRT